jgi:hypothetical protein
MKLRQDLLHLTPALHTARVYARTCQAVQHCQHHHIQRQRAKQSLHAMRVTTRRQSIPAAAGCMARLSEQLLLAADCTLQQVSLTHA